MFLKAINYYAKFSSRSLCIAEIKFRFWNEIFRNERDGLREGG